MEILINYAQQSIEQTKTGKQAIKLVSLFPYLPVYFPSYNFSSSSTILLSTSKPPCQNLALLISTPASLKIFAGASEPPEDRILRYFGLKESPSALYC